MKGSESTRYENILIDNTRKQIEQLQREATVLFAVTAPPVEHLEDVF